MVHPLLSAAYDDGTHPGPECLPVRILPGGDERLPFEIQDIEEGVALASSPSRSPQEKCSPATASPPQAPNRADHRTPSIVPFIPLRRTAVKLLLAGAWLTGTVN